MAVPNKQDPNRNVKSTTTALQTLTVQAINGNETRSNPSQKCQTSQRGHQTPADPQTSNLKVKG
jgi:hypothetical protein